MPRGADQGGQRSDQLLYPSLFKKWEDSPAQGPPVLQGPRHVWGGLGWRDSPLLAHD